MSDTVPYEDTSTEKGSYLFSELRRGSDISVEEERGTYPSGASNGGSASSASGADAGGDGVATVAGEKLGPGDVDPDPAVADTATSVSVAGVSKVSGLPFKETWWTFGVAACTTDAVAGSGVSEREA
jgi:hypothetical protein